MSHIAVTEPGTPAVPGGIHLLGPVPRPEVSTVVVWRTDDLLRLIPGIDRTEKPSTTKYNRLDDLFGRLLGVDPVGVYTTGISKPGNVTVRATQSQRAVRARYLVLLVEDAELPNQLTGTVAAAPELVGLARSAERLLYPRARAGRTTGRCATS